MTSETPDDRRDPGDAPVAPETGRDRGVTEALRQAVSETLAATSGSAASTRERAGGLIDDLVRRGREELERGRQEAGHLARRGQEATGEIARRGQEATGEIARRGQEATGEIARRGQEASGELARRGSGAREEIAKRGGDARDELARRFEAFEARLASVEELLRSPRRSSDAAPEAPAPTDPVLDPGAAASPKSAPHPDPEAPPTSGGHDPNPGSPDSQVEG